MQYYREFGPSEIRKACAEFIRHWEYWKSQNLASIRLRSGRQRTVEGKTELRIRQFLDGAVGISKPK